MANATDYLEKGISPMQPVINATQTGTNTGADGNTGIVLNEEKCLGFVNLRLKADVNSATDAVEKVLDLELPAINTRASNNAIAVLGFGPSEWLIITAPGAETDMVNHLTTALGNAFSLVCDVTGGTTKLNIMGFHAQDLLEKGTYVDLHDSVFKPNTLYATQIAHAPVTIVKNASNDFSLIVRRSFSDHIARWAVDGATAFGVSFK